LAPWQVTGVDVFKEPIRAICDHVRDLPPQHEGDFLLPFAGILRTEDRLWRIRGQIGTS
jgi:hypothetical protein